jgi:Protein of unknown function (DUF5818)
MKRSAILRAVWKVGLALALAPTLSSGKEAVTVFQGEIADSQCAMNVHSVTRSHNEMLKSKSMGGTPASCSLYCVKYMGGDFVLSTKKDVYRLDDQAEAQKFAGQAVKVTGTLDSKTSTIHVVKIEAEQ